MPSQIENWEKRVLEGLESFLSQSCHSQELLELIRYGVMPPGKLFRSKLHLACASDLGEITDNHIHFAIALELHHTYSLIHDDLPAMDDDDYRRGKLATHKKFSEWEAILSGDSLINLSYLALSKINHPSLGNILQIFADYMGPNGLILGQYLDLCENSQNFEDILFIHQMKTGKLIELSLQGAAYLTEKSDLKEELTKLGMAIGENFQLLDDLCELGEDIGEHEMSVNPFLKYDVNEVMERVQLNGQLIDQISKNLKLGSVTAHLAIYMDKTKSILENNSDRILSYLKQDIDLTKLIS